MSASGLAGLLGIGLEINVSVTVIDFHTCPPAANPDISADPDTKGLDRRPPPRIKFIHFGSFYIRKVIIGHPLLEL
jgi:hypothetical protein